MPERRPHAPPASRLGRLARLGALSTRALPIATEAMRRAAFGKRSDADAEREARKRVLENAKKTAEAMLKTLGEMKGLPPSSARWRRTSMASPRPATKRSSSRSSRSPGEGAAVSREAATKVVTKELGPPEEGLRGVRSRSFRRREHRSGASRGDEERRCVP